jgi:hypothetical protein
LSVKETEREELAARMNALEVTLEEIQAENPAAAVNAGWWG